MLLLFAFVLVGRFCERDQMEWFEAAKLGTYKLNKKNTCQYIRPLFKKTTSIDIDARRHWCSKQSTNSIDNYEKLRNCIWLLFVFRFWFYIYVGFFLVFTRLASDCLFLCLSSTKFYLLFLRRFFYVLLLLCFHFIFILLFFAVFPLRCK